MLTRNEEILPFCHHQGESLCKATRGSHEDHVRCHDSDGEDTFMGSGRQKHCTGRIPFGTLLDVERCQNCKGTGCSSSCQCVSTVEKSWLDARLQIYPVLKAKTELNDTNFLVRIKTFDKDTHRL